MLSFFRIIKFALQDMIRNVSLSFMTVLILILMLLSINSLVIVRALTDQTIETVKEQIDVSVYFSHDATEEEIQEMRDYAAAFPEVTEITFFTEEEVLADFRETHKDNPDIIASLDELSENPLGPTMIIKTRDPGDYGNIIEALSVPEYENIVEAKTFGDTQKAIERVTVVTKQVQQGVYALTGLFAIIAFFVIFNTIRVAIYTQRTEISIKKLVGASNWYVRGPYIIESFVFTVISVAVTAALIYFLIQFLDPYLSVVLGEKAFLTNYFSSNILLLAGAQFAMVLIMTIVTSGLAMRRYLRV